MAPQTSCENTESMTVEVKNTQTLPEVEKTVSYDALLANATDTQQLGVSSLMCTDINDVYVPLR